MIGPATARIAERGWTDVLSRILFCSASSIVSKSPVLIGGSCLGSAKTSSSRAKRALVPPISPIRIGKEKLLSLAPGIALSILIVAVRFRILYQLWLKSINCSAVARLSAIGIS
ncbi:hypothetical protein D3C86_1953610 [compost metagenome]